MKQETFLRVLQQIRSQGGIDHPERLGGFVNSVCNRVMMEFFRSEGRHPQLQEVRARSSRTTLSTLKAPWLTTSRNVWSDSVLAELSGKDRTILRMVFLEELDKEQSLRYHARKPRIS